MEETTGHDKKYEECPQCLGTKEEVRVHFDEKGKESTTTITCHVCKGKGFVPALFDEDEENSSLLLDDERFIPFDEEKHSGEWKDFSDNI